LHIEFSRKRKQNALPTRTKVLVYGATGSQGRAVVWKLLQNGHIPHVLTRHPQKAEAMQHAGAQIVIGDMNDYESLKVASAQMDAVALMIPAFIPDPSLVPNMANNAINAAKGAGVKLLVYNTSGTVINEMTHNPMFDMRLQLIHALQNSGVLYITIEPTVYMENLRGPWTLPALVASDVLQYPVAADLPLGWIATEDVGALIVAAAEHPELSRRCIPVSGIDNLTGPELAASFTRGLGRSISYRELPLPEFAAIIDQVMGAGVGQGASQAYKFQAENRDKLLMWFDMRPVLTILPIQMTSAENWAAKNAQAFSVPVTSSLSSSN